MMLGIEAYWSDFKQPKYLDPYLLFATIGLMLMGLVLVTTASINFASVNFDNPWFFMQRQLIFMLLAVFVGLAVLSLSSQFFYKSSTVLLFVGLFALALLFIPGLAIEVNGSRRWLPLGLFNLQPSELAKFTLVLFLAAYLQRQQAEVFTKFFAFVKPLIVMSAYAILVLLQPDWGATAILVGATAAMLFLAGARLLWFMLCLSVVGFLMYLALSIEGYRVARLMSFRDPWAPEFIHGAGYQLTQSLIGVGRGGWWGQGLGNSIQKLAFLPEAHTDFIFAIAGEELGFAGHLIIIALFSILIWRILAIGWRAQCNNKLFEAYFCYGVATVFALQFMVNTGVNIGLLPTKGLTLPFISYGGASLLISVLMVMLCQRIHHELQQEVARG